MTQIEPESVMTTSTIVKISASMVQPPSERVFIWRKWTMWTTICRKPHDDQGQNARIRDDMVHHQPERDGREDHRQDEARHIALEGAVPGLFVVGQGFDVGVDAVDLGAHGSTLTR